MPSGTQAEHIPVSSVWNDQEYFYFLWKECMTYHMSTPSIKFASTHFYTWMERGTIHYKNKLLDQKQNASKMLCPNQGLINLECSIESSMQTTTSRCRPQCAVVCLLCYICGMLSGKDDPFKLFDSHIVCLCGFQGHYKNWQYQMDIWKSFWNCFSPDMCTNHLTAS